VPNTTSGIPYPLATDPPNGASQMQSLAAAVEALLSGGASIRYAYATTPSFTSTTAFTVLLSANLSIPTYWAGYRVFVWGGGYFGIDQTIRVGINLVTAPNSTVSVGGRLGFTVGSATGTATGTVPVQLDHSGQDGGAAAGVNAHLIAFAIRSS
jgi:hypothetical protein